MNNSQPIRTIGQKVVYKVVSDEYNEGCWAIEIEIEDQFDSPKPLIIKYPLMIGIASHELAESICNDLTETYGEALNDLYRTNGLVLCAHCGDLFLPKSMKLIGERYYCKSCADSFMLRPRRKDNERAKITIRASELTTMPT